MNFQTTYDASTETWCGRPVKPVHNPNVSIASALFSALSQDPDHVGQINDNNGVRLTNENIRLNAVRLAMNLQRGQLCVRKDDVIGLVSKNHEKVSAVVFAAFALAAPINTLDPNFKAEEIAHMFRSTRPSLVFCDSDAVSQVQQALSMLEMTAHTPIVTVDRFVDGAFFVEDLLKPYDDEHLFVPNDFEDGTKQTALIACSSGTTGPSKGVSISHALLLHQLSAFVGPIEPDAVYLSFSSLYWLTGIVALITGSLFGITRIITTRPFEAKLFLDIVERYGVTITLIAPYHMGLILQCPNLPNTNLTSMIYFLSGGGVISNEHLAQLNKFLPVVLCNVYGISEFSGMIAANVDGRPSSVGRIKENVSVRIIDANGKHCGPQVDGEICIKHIFPVLGYWGDAVATAEAIDSAGWFRTGDVGHFDEDGYLYLVDRKKDIMKYNNHQISPSELEEVVLRCPGVAQVCAVGVWDEVNATDLPTALVVKVAGHSVSREDIEAIVKGTLSDAKQLRGGVFFVQELPVTPSGKVLRRKVRDIAVQLRQRQFS